MTAALTAEGARRQRERKAEWWARYIVHQALTVLTSGWFFMLGVGVARHEWLPTLPTVGYWISIVLAALARGTLVLGLMPGSRWMDRR